MKFFAVIALLVAAASAVLSLHPNLRIIGGHNIPITQVPWQISLQWFNFHFCGGSIISEKYVLTAAHCTGRTPSDEWTIRAGTNIRGEGGRVVNITKINIHPKCNYTSMDYDVAILELETPLEFSDSVAPIQLPEEGKTWPEGTQGFVSGWGYTVESGNTLSDVLKGAKVDLLRKEACQKAVEDLGIEFNNRMVCGSAGGKNPCQGDGGGPLVVDKVLGGIVSFGGGCLNSEYPGIYTNVSEIRDYIKEITEL